MCDQFLLTKEKICSGQIIKSNQNNICVSDRPRQYNYFMTKTSVGDKNQKIKIKNFLISVKNLNETFNVT